ncbi:MAG: hypothetical protein WCG00_14865 [Hyphomicrobiales bacterium]
MADSLLLTGQNLPSEPLLGPKTNFSGEPAKLDKLLIRLGIPIWLRDH